MGSPVGDRDDGQGAEATDWEGGEEAGIGGGSGEEEAVDWGRKGETLYRLPVDGPMTLGPTRQRQRLGREQSETGHNLQLLAAWMA